MSVCPACDASYDATVRICPTDGTPLAVVSAADPNIGQLLEGKYRIDAFISAGGMGSVYRATHVMLDKTVAIKLIRGPLVPTAEAAMRFQREARAASALAHPNIAAVFDFGQTAAGTLYIAMEYVKGPSLKEIIRQDGPMKPATIVAILGPVASALAWAHRHHIVHRDLKPHNIVLATDRDGRQIPKLLDFGIAKSGDEPANGLTETGYALGTPQYMSPEQAMGKPVDGRSDLYSLGVVLYEMLIGEVPFADTSVAGVLLKQMTAAPDAPSRRRPDVAIAPALEAIALRCLDKEPDHRFQSADELIAALVQAGAADGPAVAMPGAVPAAMAVVAQNPAKREKSDDGGSSVAAVSATTVAVIQDANRPSRSAPAIGAVQPADPSNRTEPWEPPALVVKPGTQPTVAVSALPPDLASAPSKPSAAPGPAFWIAAAVVVLTVVGSGAWVIRSWTPSLTVENESAPAPTATPAMAQPAPSADAAQEQPSTGAASLANSQAVSTTRPPDTGRQPPGAASPLGTAPVETPPQSAVMSPAGQLPSIAAPPTSAPRPASVTGASNTVSSAGPVAGDQARPAAPVHSGDIAGQTVPDTGASAPVVRGQSGLPAAPSRAGPPTVFVGCDGPAEICSPVRSAMADALRREQMQPASSRAGADVTIAVDVEVLEQRVQQSFGTTFAPRTYSVDVSGESHGQIVAMPPARTFSFDAQVGRERANENARMIASDAVDKIRHFWMKQP